MKKLERLSGIAWAVMMLPSTHPLSAFAVPNTNISFRMLNNPCVDALEDIKRIVKDSKNNHNVIVRYGNNLGSNYAASVYYADVIIGGMR